MGAPAGDLYLRVVVRPHEFFERRGDDLYTKIPVTVSEATLGAKIEVPTIDGRSLVRIPPGTNSGKTLRLKEKAFRAQGMARGRPVCGDSSVVPPPTDERVRNLMKELESVAPGIRGRTCSVRREYEKEFSVIRFLSSVKEETGNSKSGNWNLEF